MFLYIICFYTFLLIFRLYIKFIYSTHLEVYIWVHVFPQVNMGAVGIVIVQSLLCILALVVFVVWDGEMLVGRRWGEMWWCSWDFVWLEGS